MTNKTNCNCNNKDKPYEILKKPASVGSILYEGRLITISNEEFFVLKQAHEDLKQMLKALTDIEAKHMIKDLAELYDIEANHLLSLHTFGTNIFSVSEEKTLFN